MPDGPEPFHLYWLEWPNRDQKKIDKGEFTTRRRCAYIKTDDDGHNFVLVTGQPPKVYNGKPRFFVPFPKTHPDYPASNLELNSYIVVDQIECFDVFSSEETGYLDTGIRGEVQAKIREYDDAVAKGLV